VRDGFFKNVTQRALDFDAKRASHPVDIPIPTEDTINQVFDALTYEKAAAGALASPCLRLRAHFRAPVLGMLAAHVGEERYLAGVSLYLRRHVYGNTTSKDLWDVLSEVTGADVAALMGPWMKQVRTGVPVCM
jgi:aminopeptidase 2